MLSTHPPTERRLKNLADTADALAGKRTEAQYEGVDEWAGLIEPYQALLLREQVYLNDPGASLYLLEDLAKDGWNGVLRFYEGEAYRLRGASGDDLKAANAYAAATMLDDAPPEAWRAHGFALLKAGKTSEAHTALDRYLAMKPAAADAEMIRFTRTQPPAGKFASVTDRQMTVKPGAGWRRVSATSDERQWEEVWTWNGPQHDRTTFIGGLRDGKAIASQELNADQQVPLFRADMTSQDLASMLEVSYRINGVTVFHFDSIEPVDFLGGTGVRLRYNYVSGIGITKKGDCVMRVVNQKLYALRLESLADQDFDTVVPEFDQLVAEARLNE